ncbi:MAG: glycosyltransferase family 39 protein [Acidobacteriota bacterium]
MVADDRKRNILSGGIPLILGFSLFKLVIHLYSNLFANYGIFRDELYYLACADRLAPGYVDHPPLSIHILSLWKWIFGENLFVLRFLPALLGALTVLLTGLIIRRLRGGNLAVIFGCLAVIGAPVMLAMNTTYSMNSFDFFFWTLAMYLCIAIVQEPHPRLWMLLGLVIGLGLLNKAGVLWLGAGILLAFLFTKNRRQFKTSGPWAAGGLAALLFSPFIIWNIFNDFAHLEFIRNATSMKYAGITRLDFIGGQILLQNPVSLFLWIAGLYYFFFHREGKQYRIVGIVYAVVFAILLINGHSKPEYLSPIYPALFAGGAVWLEGTRNRKFPVLLKLFLAVLLVTGGVFLAPVGLPVLPEAKFGPYIRTLGISPPSTEGHELEALPQYYADMHGWRDMARTVSGVYQTLPEEERRKTIVFAQNYGEAGAVEYYTSTFDLPPVICPHNSFWKWSRPLLSDFETVIVLGRSREDFEPMFESVEEAAVTQSRWAIPYENNLPVYICRGFKGDITLFWEQLRTYH